VHRILALWCHPRSLSTAFERMMIERGDVAIVHEPFLYLYYVVQNPGLVIAQQLEQVESWMQTGFDEIVDRIEAATAQGPVFFKDMAVHVHNAKGFHADDVFLDRFSNALLIRDPEIAVPSHLKQNPGMVFEEVGYDAQFAVFDKVREMTGETPVVIDAADLETDPDGIVQAYCDAMGIPYMASALRWKPTVPPMYSADDPWHADVFTTTGFEQNVEAVAPDVRAHPRFEEYRDRSMPFYEAMHAHLIQP
jgi:hypothetical protein